MSAYLPDNSFRSTPLNDTHTMLPIHTRTHPIKTDELDYFRNDPQLLLMNHQDVCNIINPEYERGGIQTRDYVKSVYGTNLENTIRVPFSSVHKESYPIKPEYMIQLHKDSPFITYINNCK